MNLQVADVATRDRTRQPPFHEQFAVVGLGYVGLPVATAFARRGCAVVGFDIAEHRIAALSSGVDVTGEVGAGDLRAPSLRLTADAAGLADATFFIVTVPTPVDREHRPDLEPLAD